MRRRSGDGLVESRLRLFPTLYRCLRRLEEREALTGEPEAMANAIADGRDGRPHRPYLVTERGGSSDRSLCKVEAGLER